MDKDDFNLLYNEIKECRKEIVNVKVELATLRGKNAAWASIIALVFSGIVSWITKS